jgi:hypothetical protein
VQTMTMAEIMALRTPIHQPMTVGEARLPGCTPAAYGGSPWPFISSRLLAPGLAVHGGGRQAWRAGGAPLKL